MVGNSPPSVPDMNEAQRVVLWTPIIGLLRWHMTQAWPVFSVPKLLKKILFSLRLYAFKDVSLAVTSVLLPGLMKKTHV